MTDLKTFTGPEGYTFTLIDDGVLIKASPTDHGVLVPLADLNAFIAQRGQHYGQHVRCLDCSRSPLLGTTPPGEPTALGLPSRANGRTVGTVAPDLPDAAAAAAPDEQPEEWQCGKVFFHPSESRSTHCRAGAPGHDGPHINPYDLPKWEPNR